MISEHKMTEDQIRTFVKEEASELEISNSKLGIGLIMTMAGFVGAWGCICLINGIVQANSIHEIGRGIFTAITGI